MHLDVRSWFTFHDGVAAPENICQLAASLGHEQIGLCDVDGTHGLISFYMAALRCNVKPVLGISLSDPRVVGPGPCGRLLPLEDDAPGRSRRSRVAAGVAAGQAGAGDPTLAAASVIAGDRAGYSQLCALAAARNLDPRFDLAGALEQMTDRCFVATDQPYLLERLSRRIPPARLYVRTTPNYGELHRAKQVAQLKLARKHRLSPLACTDVRFLFPQDQHVHAVLRAIGQNTDLQRVAGVRSRSHYLSAPVELPGYYLDCPEALDNARTVAERCNVELETGVWHPPRLSLPGGRDAQQVLYELCLRGAQSRFGSGFTDQYRGRLDYELEAIARLGFAEYFIFIYDLLLFAMRERIPYLGRGSAGNSLVSYLLGITPVDPIEQNLWFERFINPSRKSPPDVDIDFASDRRDEVLRYLYERWGEHRVAMICTHNRFQARGALREVGKVFGLSDAEICKVSRQLPHIPASMLPGAAGRYSEMKGVDLSEETFRRILPLAAKLDGVPHHVGVHCAGLVVAPTKTTDFTGLQLSAENLVITQYDMYDIEHAGLIKVDILGNCGLQALDTTLRSLAERGVHPPVHNWKELVKDERTARSIAEGRTMGCFYVESPAMLQLQRKLNPLSFEDLTIATSIIRPGVAQSGMMDEYIRRAKGQPRKLRTHPLLDQMLPETNGVMVFQEDVIRAGMELAGLSAADADILRRSMSGKGRSHRSMVQLRDNFLDGCKRRGIEREDAEEVWRQVASFAGYSFCKSHSACFSVLSYQVTYLKEYHPAEYMAAVLSHDGGFYSNHSYISECRRLRLEVLLPDVNYSHLDYRAEGIRAIRVSLSVIRNVRGALKERIVRERERAGRFRSLREFIRRCRPQRGELDILLQCGALDSLGMTRSELQWRADQEYVATMRQPDSPLLPLSESAQPAAVATLPDYDELTRLRMEQEHLGMLVSRHPLELVEPPPGTIPAAELARHVGRRVRLLGWCIATKRVSLGDRAAVRASLGQPEDEWADDENELKLSSNRDSHQGAAEDIGLVRPANLYLDQPGRVMKFLSMEDPSARYEVVVFPQAYQRVAQLTLYQGPFLVEGTVRQEFGEQLVDCSGLALLDGSN